MHRNSSARSIGPCANCFSRGLGARGCDQAKLRIVMKLRDCNAFGTFRQSLQAWALRKNETESLSSLVLSFLGAQVYQHHSSSSMRAVTFCCYCHMTVATACSLLLELFFLFEVLPVFLLLQLNQESSISS